MNNVKFTGVNIAAALLIIGYFLPWAGGMGLSMSGFSLMTNGISPGMLAYFITGLNRLFLILTIVVPLSGALILYQNITGNTKYAKFYKPAHFIPALFLIAAIVILHFKMKPEAMPDSGMGADFDNMSRSMANMAPGVFDIISVGVYVSLIAGLYLLLVNMGTIKDKEYYKPNAAPAENTPPNQE